MTSCCSVKIDKYPDSENMAIYIYGVATLPEYRNQGSATSMINYIIKKYNKIYDILLFVDKVDDEFFKNPIEHEWTEEETIEIEASLEEERKEIRKIVKFYINRGFYELPGTDFRRFGEFNVYALQYNRI
jgi:GNAT superfamily N-acetyltransferase